MHSFRRQTQFLIGTSEFVNSRLVPSTCTLISIWHRTSMSRWQSNVFRTELSLPGLPATEASVQIARLWEKFQIGFSLSVPKSGFYEVLLTLIYRETFPLVILFGHPLLPFSTIYHWPWSQLQADPLNYTLVCCPNTLFWHLATFWPHTSVAPQTAWTSSATLQS